MQSSRITTPASESKWQ
ncbi:hypothetical protein LEMLEM_LOCUS20090 [Lemmus lemmus]